MLQYSFVLESKIPLSDKIYGTVGSSFVGAVLGGAIGKLVDYIRSSGARAEADKKRVEYLIAHKDDYSDKDIIHYLNHIIDRNKRRVTELNQQLISARNELNQVVTLLSSYKSNDVVTTRYGNDGSSQVERKRYSDDDEVTRLKYEKRRLEYLIKELHSAISECNDTISQCMYYLDRKHYSTTRNELINRDADAERERVYDRLRKKHGWKIGAGLGAAAGAGIATKMYYGK